MERYTILLLVLFVLMGLSLGEINEVTGEAFKSVLKARAIRQSTQCIDSDGLNLNIKGNVSGIINGISFTNIDICISKNVVREYLCYDRPESKTYPCPTDYNCQDGACV